MKTTSETMDIQSNNPGCTDITSGTGTVNTDRNAYLNLDWFSKLLYKIFPYFGIFTLMFMLTGCGHNTGMFFSGFAAKVGMDAQNNYVPEVAIIDGVSISDISRENSFWIVEVDSVAGITISKDGTIKGVKSFRRYVGPQANGYLVDLAKTDPALAKAYAEAVKAFWDALKVEQK